MERYELLLIKNERQINRRTAMICIYELCVIGVVLLLDYLRLFTTYSFAEEPVWKCVLAVLLLLPAGMVFLLRLEGKWVKYGVMVCSVLASGLCYIIFNAQASLILLFPTVLAALYYNQRLSMTVFILSIITILASHVTASYLILPLWFKNPYGFRYVLVDTAIPQALFYICFALVIWLLNRKTLQLLYDVYKASRRNEVLALEKETAEMRGRLDERERISRDIHNSVGHTITAAIFALEAAKMQRSTNPAAADEKTDRAIERMRESMDIIRNSVRVLDKNNVLTVQELCKTLTLCSRQMELDTAVQVEMVFEQIGQKEMEQPLCSDYIGYLYGAVQECITNGMKHGGARHFRVRLRMEADDMEIEIRNDGTVPGHMPEESFGLRKLRSYAGAVGGEMEICLEGGYAVRLRLPLEPAEVYV